MDNIYSTKEAAARLKLSEAHVRRLLEGGQIAGKKLGRDWIVFSLEYKRKRKAKKHISKPVKLAIKQS
jgi:excisionase family DNA binding protein